jgi:hypothetical protein
VGQLVVFLAAGGRGDGIVGCHPFRIGRRDQPQFPVQEVQRFFQEQQPEIHDVRSVFQVQQDIARLDVPMHQAPFMGVMQRLGHRRRPADCLDRAYRGALHASGQVAALDVLRDDIGVPALGASHVMHGHDMRMVQAGQRTGFGQVDRDLLRTRNPCRAGGF